MLRVFENRVLSKMLGSERDQVTADWRTLHNVELNDLHSLLNNSQTIKSRRIRLAGNAALIGDRRKLQAGFWWRNTRKRCHWEHPGLDGRIILKWIFSKRKGDMDWTGLSQDTGRWGGGLMNAVMNLRV